MRPQLGQASGSISYTRLMSIAQVWLARPGAVISGASPLRRRVCLLCRFRRVAAHPPGLVRVALIQALPTSRQWHTFSSFHGDAGPPVQISLRYTLIAQSAGLCGLAGLCMAFDEQNKNACTFCLFHAGIAVHGLPPSHIPRGIRRDHRETTFRPPVFSRSVGSC